MQAEQNIQTASRVRRKHRYKYKKESRSQKKKLKVALQLLLAVVTIVTAYVFVNWAFRDNAPITNAAAPVIIVEE